VSAESVIAKQQQLLLHRPLALHLPTRLGFGAGGLAACAEWFAARAARVVLVVTSPPLAPLCEPLAAALRDQGLKAHVWEGVTQEPRIAHLQAGMRAARDCGADAIAGIGGGSAMDVAKLIAALLDGRQRIGEVFGIGLLHGRALPLACLPTTAGTGSEVSPIAIMQDTTDGQKKAIISSHLVPDAAFVDPALTIGAPREVTAASGIDALTHCIEAYANRQAHPFTDVWALEGIRRIGRSLVQAFDHPDDLAARSDVALGSLYGGLCLGPVNTAAVHALAYPPGSDHGIAHGVSNAVILPHVLEFNRGAIETKMERLAAYCGIARGFDGFLAHVNALCDELKVPRSLPAFIDGLEMDEERRKLIAEMAIVDPTAGGNPVELTVDGALDILDRAMKGRG